MSETINIFVDDVLGMLTSTNPVLDSLAAYGQLERINWPGGIPAKGEARQAHVKAFALASAVNPAEGLQAILDEIEWIDLAVEEIWLQCYPDFFDEDSFFTEVLALDKLFCAMWALKHLHGVAVSQCEVLRLLAEARKRIEECAGIKARGYAAAVVQTLKDEAWAEAEKALGHDTGIFETTVFLRTLAGPLSKMEASCLTPIQGENQ